MASYRQQQLKIVAALNRDMGGLYRALAADVQGVVRRNSVDGRVPTENLVGVRKQVGRLVTAMFLHRDPQTGDLIPFDVRQGRVLPTAPFMTVLWRHVRAITRVSVGEQASLMTRKLKGQPDLLAQFQRARVNPFALAKARESDNINLSQLNEYDPFHLFVYGNSPYTLSTRIWDVAARTRQKLDGYLTDAISQGKSSLTIANEVEQFLNPARKGIVTNKPYGIQASYDGMRLARTEINAAAHRSAYTSAQLNPFVTQYERRLSNRRRGPCDICKSIAAGGPYDKTDAVHLPPTHPNCMCYIVWLTIPLDEALPRINEPLPRYDLPVTALITPVQIEQFAALLLREVTGDDLAVVEGVTGD